MRPSRIKAKLRRREAALVTTLHLTDPSIFELTSLLGFDGIWMDLEHHGYSVETATNLMRAARVGASDIVARPAKGEFMRMARLLEAGASAIMYPRCDSAAEAAEVVRWAKFAPLGERGADGGNPDMPYCSMPLKDYVRAANEETSIIIQLESPAALRHAEEIARVPGVDVLMLGPGDLSVLAGVPGESNHPIILEAHRTVASAAHAADIHWGTVSSGPEHTRSLLAMDARFVCHNADLMILRRGLEKIQADYAALGFTFDNRLAALAAPVALA
jgi:4-hydroxy-2-oxoheptanedioate aldolase